MNLWWCNQHSKTVMKYKQCQVQVLEYQSSVRCRVTVLLVQPSPCCFMFCALQDCWTILTSYIVLVINLSVCVKVTVFLLFLRSFSFTSRALIVVVFEKENLSATAITLCMHRCSHCKWPCCQDCKVM